MVEWTDAARKELARYMAHVRERLSTSDADANEVEEDLLRHINEEATAAGLEIITSDNVTHFSDKMGLPIPSTVISSELTPDTESNPDASKKRQSTRKTKRHRYDLGGILFFGVILPLGALILEILTGMCASIFFDPIPTLWHAALVGFVPLANFIAYIALLQKNPNHPKTHYWLNGLAFGIALYYSLVFLPLTPFAAIGVIYLGLGLIPLSPLISFCCTWIVRRKLTAMLPGSPKPMLWKPIIIVFLCLIAFDMPKIITTISIQRAVYGSAGQRASAVRMLRSFGNDNELLRACYGVNKPVTDMIGYILRHFTEHVTGSQVQEVYYKVTGTPYNAVEPPDLKGLTRGSLINSDDWDFDQGGDKVAARVRGLTLQQSLIDGRIDSDAGTAYAEWTMIFHNTSSRQREARATIALPSGSVVSRVTLWIDGEEREAAYAGRAKVKAAYKKVVKRRRDPVLVTTSGPDRILMQCFPVPPHGGTMKIKVGITSPLILESLDSGIVRLPSFVEQNFAINDATKHAVWYEASRHISAATSDTNILQPIKTGDIHCVKGEISESDLVNSIAIRVKRNSEITKVWTEAERGPTGHCIVQRIVTETNMPPSQLAIVIDCSKRMKPYSDILPSIVEHLMKMTTCEIYLASDELIHIKADSTEDPDQSRQTILNRIQKIKYIGGCDNIPALERAWDNVFTDSHAAILWLHATQPSEMQQTEPLLQRFKRHPGHPDLFDYQFGGGPNVVATKLANCSSFKRLPQLEGPQKDLAQLAKQWEGTVPILRYKRKAVLTDDVIKPSTHVDLHIARLWAHKRVLQLAQSRNPEDRNKAINLATSYLLVTPVSGAVVLETQQQYTEAGLTPTEPHLTPAVVPEPETWCLITLGLLIIIIHSIIIRWRKKQRRGVYV